MIIIKVNYQMLCSDTNFDAPTYSPALGIL